MSSGYPSPYGSAPPPPLPPPTAAFILSMLGGLVILVWGIFLVGVGVANPGAGPFFFGGSPGGVGIIEILCGGFVVMFAVFLYQMRQHHVLFGATILVFSCLSLLGLGGLLIGFLLGLIGAILAIAHAEVSRPPPTPVYVGYYYGPQTGYYAAPSPYAAGYGAPLAPVSAPPVPPPPPAEKYCGMCGAGNVRAAAFCVRCGRPLPPPS